MDGYPRMSEEERKKIVELIITIGYVLDAIDVRATDPMRFGAKETAKESLVKLIEYFNK